MNFRPANEEKKNEYDSREQLKKLRGAGRGGGKSEGRYFTQLSHFGGGGAEELGAASKNGA